MESSPQVTGGGSFIGPWGTLDFHLPLGGELSQMGGLKFSTLLGRGQQGFLYWGDGRSL